MIDILAYDHMGLRVVDRDVSLRFYQKLGLIEDQAYSNERVAEVINVAGVRLNLIFNGVRSEERFNILLDCNKRWPGYTHGAFIVRDLRAVLDWAKAENITITEGPHDWGRRKTCFLRDPDGNVLEFNELKPDSKA